MLTNLGTYLVLKRIWNPIDFQGQRSRSLGKIFRRGDTPRFVLPLLKINLFSPWYSWKIAELVLNNNHSLTHISSISVWVFALWRKRKVSFFFSSTLFWLKIKKFWFWKQLTIIQGYNKGMVLTNVPPTTNSFPTSLPLLCLCVILLSGDIETILQILFYQRIIKNSTKNNPQNTLRILFWCLIFSLF